MPMTKEDATIVIQKKWRKEWGPYLAKMKLAVRDIWLAIDTIGGKKIIGARDLEKAFEIKDIVVQINVDDQKPDPKSGHSAFYMGEPIRCYELTFTDTSDVKKATALSKPYTIAPSCYIYTVIFGGVPERYNADKVKHLASKNVLYRISGEYIPLLEQASGEEIAWFQKKTSYTYGYHYNCHVYIRNCLQRLVTLIAKHSPEKLQMLETDNYITLIQKPLLAESKDKDIFDNPVDAPSIIRACLKKKEAEWEQALELMSVDWNITSALPISVSSMSIFSASSASVPIFSDSDLELESVSAASNSVTPQASPSISTSSAHPPSSLLSQSISSMLTSYYPAPLSSSQSAMAICSKTAPLIYVSAQPSNNLISHATGSVFTHVCKK